MNKKFTKLIAALALLVFMTPSLVAWGQTYTLATSIAVGDEVVLVNTTVTVELSGMTTSGTLYGQVTDVTNQTPTGVYPLIVEAGSESGTFAFKTPDNKYLQYTGTSNTLSTTDEITKASSWTFTNSYGTYLLNNANVTNRQIKYNSSSPRFACYTSGQTNIKLYKRDSSLQDSDLALTGAPVALSFDLYNNASAQVINYTTSSTGAVTVSESEYVTSVVDETAKTITVTPTAVTPNVQTITVSQAADATYSGGSVTFTVEVANSTPTTTVTIDDSGITNTDVYVSTAAGSLSATVTSGGSAVSGATVTWSGDNDAVATIASDGTVTLVGAGVVNFTASYAGAAGQYMPSYTTYEMNVTNSEPYVQPTTIEITPNYNFWGKTGQFSGSTYSELEGSKDNVTLSWTRGSGSMYASSTAMRFYKDNNLTFSAPDGYEITSIVITFTTAQSDLSFSPEGYSLSGTTGTWTGSSATVTMSRPSNADSYAQISKFTITLAQLAPKHTLTITMSNVADFTIFVGDETVSGPDPENPSPTVQVSAGTTVGVSIGGMENCYLFGSLTVNGSTAGVTQDDPDDPYFEFTMPDEDAEIDVTTTDATPFTLTVVGMDNVSFDMYMGYNSTEVTITDGTASICEQMHVTIDDLTVPSGFILEPITLTYGNTTEEVNVALGFTMPSSNATLTFTTHEAASFTYTKVNSVMPGKHYIIVTSSTDNSGNYHAMGGKSSGGSYMDPIVVSVDNNTVTVAENEGVAEILISGTAGNYTLHTSEGYLVGGNKLMNTNGTESSTWSISFNDSDQAIITWTINTTDYSIQYNSQSPRFACYSSSQAKVCLYEKVPTLHITAHTTTGGWNLIASPVAVNPENVTNMTNGDFDLYRFNGNPTPVDNVTKEWENWKQTGDHYHFDLVPGKGYLYANAATVDLIFSGTMATTLADVVLPYDSDSEIKSLYLAGNSLQQETTYYVYAIVNDEFVKQTVNFLTLNGTGDGFVTTQANAFTAQAMQGFFVQSNGEDRLLSIDDVDAKSGTPELLNIMVNQNRGTLVDNAIVSFSDAPMMSKFYLNDHSTRVYIPQNGEDMAVVRTEAQGEMPVNFRAAENGTYTLSIAAENVEMNYLHLIDNMTGMDIDLLQTPSYTFEATTRDYESRFRLVFAANNNNEDGPSTGSGTFAFYSNGNLIINNAGEATLQVVDLTGRILSSETVNGSVSKTINAVPGVYMLRLINGENVNVQKIVVR